MISWLCGELGSSFQNADGSWLALFSFCWDHLVRFEASWITIIQLELLTHTLVSVSVMMLATYVMSAMSKISFNVLKTMSEYTLISSIVTNLLATSLITYKLWWVKISSDDNNAYTWQAPLKIYQQSWSEKTTVSCTKCAVPSCRVRCLLPRITSELDFMY